MTTVGGRILVIDDLPDWRAMIGGLLSDAGYQVEVAEDEESAMRLLREQPYHAAIVDLRLDERDERNRAGLDLARRMKGYLPELAIIMVTAYADVPSVKAAFEPLSDGGSIAFDFLEKFEITKLLDRVQMAFATAARVNPQLQVELEAGLTWRQLQRDIECLRPLNPEHAQGEMKDLLQRLFHEAQCIQIKPLDQGYSSGSVVLVTPFIADIPQTDVVVKFNERTRAEREAQNYDRYVAKYVGGARRTQRLDLRTTARLGGIAYSFVGAKPAEFRRFREVYPTSDTATLKAILDSLFFETCQTWYINTLQQAAGRQSLGACYRQWLSLTNPKIERALVQLAARSKNGALVFATPNHPQQSSIYFAERSVTLANPLLLSNAPFQYSGPFCFTHGDLHEDNILVDSHNEMWLIDFYHTGPAHPVRDFALLECAIKFYLQSSAAPLAVLYDWERSLVRRSTLTERPISDPPLRLDEELTKATALILHIRRLLASMIPRMTLGDYLIALYFHALKAMTLVDKFSERQRRHALFSASLLTEVLR